MQVDIVDSYYLCVCPYNSIHMYMCIYIYIYIYMYIYTYACTNPVGLMTVQQQWQLPSVEVLHTRHVKFIKHISNECNHYNHVWSYAWKCWGTSLFEFVSSCSFLILTLTSIGLYIYICIHVYIYTYTNTTAGTQVASGLRRNRKKIMGWNQLETYQNGGQHVAMGRPDINHFVENQQRAIQSGPPLKAKLVLHIRLTMVYDEELHLYTYIHTYKKYTHT
jgi:hypothetical protein